MERGYVTRNRSRDSSRSSTSCRSSTSPSPTRWCRSRPAPGGAGAPPLGIPDPDLPGRLAARRRRRSHMPGVYDEIRRAASVPIRPRGRSPGPDRGRDRRRIRGPALPIRGGRRRHRHSRGRDEESAGSETGLYLAGVPEGDEPQVTSGQHERGWRVLGSLLLRDGLVDEFEPETALAQQRLSSTRRLGEIRISAAR